MLVSNLDSSFAVWNKLTTSTSKLQLQIQPEESSGESESQCFMVQGNDSLEVHSETQLDCNDASSSCDEHVDPNTLKSSELNKENKDLSSRLDMVLEEKVEISNE